MIKAFHFKHQNYYTKFSSLNHFICRFQYRMYQIVSMDTGKPLKFRLCDTRGLEENQGIDSNDIAYLLDGNIPDKYQVITPRHYENLPM